MLKQTCAKESRQKEGKQQAAHEYGGNDAVYVWIINDWICTRKHLLKVTSGETSISGQHVCDFFYFYFFLNFFAQEKRKHFQLQKEKYIKELETYNNLKQVRVHKNVLKQISIYEYVACHNSWGIIIVAASMLEHYVII